MMVSQNGRFYQCKYVTCNGDCINCPVYIMMKH